MKYTIKVSIAWLMWMASSAWSGPQSSAQLDILLEAWPLSPTQQSLHQSVQQGVSVLEQQLSFAYREAQSRADLRQAMDDALAVSRYQQQDLPLQVALQQTSLRLRLLAESIDAPLALVQPAENAWQQSQLALLRLQMMLPLMEQLRAMEDPRLIMAQLERLWWLWQGFYYGVIPGQVLSANDDYAFDDDPVGAGVESLLALLPNLQRQYDQATSVDASTDRPRFSF